MDFLIVILAVVAVIIALKFIKSAIKLIITLFIIFLVIRYLDQNGYIDLNSMLNQIGLVWNMILSA
ncbi:hypothetical protein [Youngiibacter fragilis]|uniref:Colicin V production protein n=1 Tax=Youngiibacter fragilis 232.1 TaxID=994573 RepID=V7I6H9_9CLOT|nr:hypothetical protein [Youngiibacter fragilis]ETA80814.1 hypothetical protein T472_0209575 [Youngiibacter fragilis 232.1]